MARKAPTQRLVFHSSFVKPVSIKTSKAIIVQTPKPKTPQATASARDFFVARRSDSERRRNAIHRYGPQKGAKKRGKRSANVFLGWLPRIITYHGTRIIKREASAARRAVKIQRGDLFGGR